MSNQFEKTKTPIPGVAVTVRGLGDESVDTSGQASSGYCKPGFHAPSTVPPIFRSLVSAGGDVSDTRYRTHPGGLDPGVVCNMDNSGFGNAQEYPNTLVTNYWGTPLPGDLYMPRVTGGAALPGVNEPVNHTQAKAPPEERNRDNTKTYYNKYNKPYTAAGWAQNKPNYGDPYSDTGHKWDEYRNTPTAAAPFAMASLSGMISGLLGSLVSLKSTFNGLSSAQQQQIQSSTTPQVYAAITSLIASGTDIGDSSTTSFSARVDQPTLANNMVSLFCNCATYTDVTTAIQLLKTDPTLQGKNKLPIQEFPVATMFGDSSIVIDNMGDATMNVSSQAANLAQAFTTYMTGGSSINSPAANFFGSVSGNTLTVSQMAYGTIQTGESNILQGFGILGNTYVVSSNTSSGTYYLNQAPLQPISNAFITITNYSTANTANNTGGGGKGGGGGGAMPLGMIPGLNFFGEASKLINEVLPTLEPAGGAGAASMVNMAGLAGSLIPPFLMNFAGVFPRFSGIAGMLGNFNFLSMVNPLSMVSAIPTSIPSSTPEAPPFGPIPSSNTLYQTYSSGIFGADFGANLTNQVILGY